MATAPLTLFKNEGNAKFQVAKYRDAIDLYTKALDSATPTTPLEDIRQVVSNRGQTYFRWGEIYNALRDTDLALSSAYTTPSSPPSVTRKCLRRKAKILDRLRRWKEAQATMEAFMRLSQEVGEPLDGEAVVLSGAINECLALPENSDERLPSDLLQAVNAREIMVQEDYLDAFPRSGKPLPPGVDPDELESVRFETIPISIGARRVSDPDAAGRPVSVRTTMPEMPLYETDASELTLGGFFDATLTAYALDAQKRHPQIKKALFRNLPCHGAKILCMTGKGRLLVIPPDTLIKDIWERMRFPRPKGAVPGFEDVRTTPRPRQYELDGPELMGGNTLGFMVTPADELGDLVAFLEIGLAHKGMP